MRIRDILWSSIITTFLCVCGLGLGFGYPRVGILAQWVGVVSIFFCPHVLFLRYNVSLSISHISLRKYPHIQYLSAIAYRSISQTSNLCLQKYEPRFIWWASCPTLHFLRRTHPLALESYNWDWEVIIWTMVTARNIQLSDWKKRNRESVYYGRSSENRIFVTLWHSN